MKLGPRDKYVPGQWNALCDSCGFKFKSSELQKDYKGLMKCKTCWEPQHPQELIRLPKEDPSVPWARPEPEDVEVVLGPADPDSL